MAMLMHHDEMHHLLLFLFLFAILLPVATSNTQTFTVAQTTTPWHHHWEESIGSGHAALTSRADWRAHLTRCATELGVKRTRFHGLLDDDFQISLQEGTPNYINLDSLIDFHLSIGMEPLFEVSFMPSWLATNKTQTVTYYKGITSPPANMTKWGTVIYEMVQHIHHRYPNNTFMFEVWNEPNGGFFTPGNSPTQETKLNKYLQLYIETSNNIKKASHNMYQVGGPASAGCPSQWLTALMNVSHTKQAAVDFLSCHSYGGGKFKNVSGDLTALDVSHVRTIAGALPVVLTEWSSSWSYNNGYHDDIASVPFILAAVDQLGPHVDISSYWTFSDVFEEGSLIPTPFHGGFGLLTIQGIPKPSFRAFQLLHGTGNVKYTVTKVHTKNVTACGTDAGILVTSLAATGVGNVGASKRIFMYNHPKNYMTSGITCTITLIGLDLGPTSAVRHSRIDLEHANPMLEWENMGSPMYPSLDQVKRLEAASELVWTNMNENNSRESGRRGGLTFDVAPNGLVVVDVLSE
jgi:xylan 1,4-beta-xylosidase